MQGWVEIYLIQVFQSFWFNCPLFCAKKVYFMCVLQIFNLLKAVFLKIENLVAETVCPRNTFLTLFWSFHGLFNKATYIYE